MGGGGEKGKECKELDCRSRQKESAMGENARMACFLLSLHS